MLVTTCKYCGARFRVTPDQLNLRQGQVRCGACEQVFNGFEALERFPGDDTGTRLLAARAGALAHPDPLEEVAGIDLGKRVTGEATPIAGSTHSAPPLPLPADMGPASLLETPLPAASVEPVDSEAISLAASVEPADSETTAPAASAEQIEAPVREAVEATRAPEWSGSAPRRAPEGVEDYVPTVPDRPSRAWAFGVVFLALVLGLQLAYAYRAKLAQQYPQVRPILESVCAAAGCTVPWVNDEAALKLEDSELLEVPGRPGQIALQARIRNLSPAAQEFPHLELTLTDITGQTAIRRVLRPADYLGHPPVTGEVMSPGSEALLSIRLETDRIKPTGYELLLFYP